MIQTEQPKATRRVLVNPAYKDKARVLRTSAETGGAYTLGEVELSPGGGNHPHTHRGFEETFTAVKGVLGIMYGRKKIYLQPGESIKVPLYKPHHFFNDGKDTVVFHVKFEPGHEGFEKGIAIAYGLAADGLSDKKGTPKNLTHLAIVLALTDTCPTGIISWLMPVFNWLAKRGRRKGVERELLRRYYYE